MWLALATVLGWSVFVHAPFANLDRSWAHGLSLVHLDGYRFGADVVFNYGPLGFVARPVVGTGALYPLAVLGTLVLTATAAWLVLATLDLLHDRGHVNGVLTLLIMLVAPLENLLIEMVVVFGAVWAVLYRRRRGALSVPVVFALGVGTILLGLIKVSVLLPAVAVLAVVAASSGRRPVGAAAAGGIVGFTVGWIGTGQSVSDVVAWLEGSAQVALGHVSAMNLDDPSRRWEYVAVGLLCVSGVFLVVDGGTRDRVTRREYIGVILTALAGCVIGWFVVRQGFTRHGARTRLVFFTMAWMLIGWAPWPRLSTERKRAVSLTIAACSGVLRGRGGIAESAGEPRDADRGRRRGRSAGDIGVVS